MTNVRVYRDRFSTFYSSLKDAHKNISRDNLPDLIYFEGDDGEHSFTPKFKKQRWNPKSEKRLEKLSDVYHKADPEALFWVDRSMDVVEKMSSDRSIQKHIREGMSDPGGVYKRLRDIPDITEADIYAASIKGVLTCDEFEVFSKK